MYFNNLILKAFTPNKLVGLCAPLALNMKTIKVTCSHMKSNFAQYDCVHNGTWGLVSY